MIQDRTIQTHMLDTTPVCGECKQPFPVTEDGYPRFRYQIKARRDGSTSRERICPQCWNKLHRETE